MNLIYKITSLTNEARLQVYGVIGSVADSNGTVINGFTLADFQRETAGLTKEVLTIELNSPGGSPGEAFAIHDAIKQLPARVIVKIMGKAASAATIIAAAADEIHISENSTYLVHNASSWAEGTKDEIAKEIETLRDIDNRMLNIYIKQTGRTRTELEELMRQDRMLSPEEALSWGFVTKIIYNNKKIAAMENQIAMTEKEKEEMEALKAEIKELKAKLKAYEDEKEQETKAKVAAKVDEAISAGKIKAEAKDHFIAFGTTNFEAMSATLDGIVVNIVPEIKGVPAQQTAPEKIGYKNKNEAIKAYKEGKIKTLKEYEEITKTMEE